MLNRELGKRGHGAGLYLRGPDRANLKTNPLTNTCPKCPGNTTGLDAERHQSPRAHLTSTKSRSNGWRRRSSFARSCDASRQTGRQVGALVHRSGKVDYVVVGDSSKLNLPDIGRLRAAGGALSRPSADPHAPARRVAHAR